MYVSPSGAFFREWRFSRHMLLLVHWSYVCLASNSQSLNRYVFSPNNHFRLASIRGPYSANSMALTTFRDTSGQSFAFYDCKDRIWTCYLHFLKTLLYRMSYIANLPWCAGPVAPYPFGIQNTTHQLFFALRATKRLFKCPGPNPSTLALLPSLCLRAQTG